MSDSPSSVEMELLNYPPRNGSAPTLDRIAALLALAGDPHRSVPTIHITGTNGKSTTARMIDELLCQHGLRTGRYTSPHLQSVRERIVIDGEPIDHQDLTDCYDQIRGHIETVDNSNDVPLSFFEIMTAIGLVAFARAGVDVAIIEVGIGGTWDATNVVYGRVCVVTPVSMDHTDYLGPNEVAIAKEKGGIVKSGSTVVVSPQLSSVMTVLTERARSVGATFVRAEDTFRIINRHQNELHQLLDLEADGKKLTAIAISLAGRHQADNVCTALAAADKFLELAGRPRLDLSSIRIALSRVSSPGRLERVASRPTIVLDVSHNPSGMRVSTIAFSEAYPNTQTVIVLAVLGDKDVVGILEALSSIASHVVLTQNESPRSLPVVELEQHAREWLPDSVIHVEPDLRKAIELARKLAAGVADSANVLVTGSTVTAGQVRSILA